MIELTRTCSKAVLLKCYPHEYATRPSFAAGAINHKLSIQMLKFPIERVDYLFWGGYILIKSFQMDKRDEGK